MQHLKEIITTKRFFMQHLKKIKEILIWTLRKYSNCVCKGIRRSALR